MKIKLKPGQQLWFVSDTHYNHSNICRSTTKWSDRSNTRDFKSLEHMNSTIVNNINKCVGEDDVLIHMGDWSFGGFDKIEEFRNRLVCKNIHIVLGNHDHHIRKNKDNIQDVFLSVHEYLHLTVIKETHPIFHSGGKLSYEFICMHYPIASWDNMYKGVIHLHGHVHLPPNQRIADGKAMDVGVDGNNYMPTSLTEVISIMNKQPIKKLSLPKDHHETNELKTSKIESVYGC